MADRGEGSLLGRLRSVLAGMFSRGSGPAPGSAGQTGDSAASSNTPAIPSAAHIGTAAAQPVSVQPTPLEVSAAAQPVSATTSTPDTLPRRLYSAMMEFLNRPVGWTRDDEPAGQASLPPATAGRRSQLPPRPSDWTSAKEHAAQRAARETASEPIFGGIPPERIAPSSAAAKPAETPSFFAFERDDDTGAEGFKTFASEADLKRRIATGEDTSIEAASAANIAATATTPPAAGQTATPAATPASSESTNREAHEQTGLLRHIWNWMRGQSAKKSPAVVGAAAAAKATTAGEFDPIQLLSQSKAHAEAEFRRAVETHGKGSTEANAARDRMVDRTSRLSRELASPGDQHIWKLYDQHVAGLPAGQSPKPFEQFKSDWMNEPVRSFKDDKQRDQWKSFLEATNTVEPKAGFTPEKELDLKKLWGQMSMGAYPEMVKGPEIFEAEKPAGNESATARQPPGFLGRIAGSIRSQTPFVRAVKSFLVGSAAASEGAAATLSPTGPTGAAAGGGPPPVNPPRGPVAGGGPPPKPTPAGGAGAGAAAGGGMLGGVAGMAIGFLAGIVPGVINTTISLAKLALPAMPRVGTKEQDTDFAIQGNKIAGFATMGLPGAGGGGGAFANAAMISATQHVKRFTDAIIESRRHLADINGVYAQQFALMDFQKMRLDAQLANRTQGSFAFAADAKMKFEEAMQPFRELGATMANLTSGLAALWGVGAAEIIKQNVAAGVAAALGPGFGELARWLGPLVDILGIGRKIEDHLNKKVKPGDGLRADWVRDMAAGRHMPLNRNQPIIPDGGLNNNVPFQPLPPLPVGPQRN